MTTRKSPVDDRPFRSKAEQERERLLELQYRRLGNAELIAVIRQMKSAGPEEGDAKRQLE